MKENKDTKYLALVDGSTYAESVCDHVAWIAKRTGGSVELINILGRRGNSDTQVNLSGSIGLGARTALLDELAEHDRQRAQLEQKRGRAILEDAKKRVEAAGVTDVVTRLRHGGLLEAVEEYEQDARVVFIGKRGEAWEIDKDHLGSNLARVVRSSNKPIFVASHTFKPLERFMIAFDGGRSSSDAVKHVSRSRSLKGLTCCLLSVVTEEKRLKRESQLERAALRLRAAGFDVDIDIQTGNPDDVIREKAAADDIDLLVMGAYGHSRIRNFIIGSTTTEMIRSCKIPVLLFR